ncbi:lambda exonuclease family protein, partial [Enterobacter cloacae complex sp. 2DZ2F20B]|uniref:lambda exonuclease family protein n=1 Tax=Enterobacter cloacae complex sp. 2DZ2F20B TaxID=2511993 RepID=UPI0021077D50
MCKLRKNTSRANVVKLLLYSNFKGNDATRYGHEMEKTAREDIGNKLNIAIDECGLFISPDQPYFAASPDGVVRGTSGIVEIKCPYTAQNLTPLEATKVKIINFCNIVTLEDDNVNKERLE